MTRKPLSVASGLLGCAENDENFLNNIAGNNDV
jgi:hypothetical protein